MPSPYIRKPPVICFNCGDEMIKRRTSKSGRYYCPKTECQNERRSDWVKDRGDARLRAEQDAHAETKRISAAFVGDALRATGVCPDCGAMNVPTGWAHFNPAGEGCGGMGFWNGRVDINLVEAVWPPSARKYEDR